MRTSAIVRIIIWSAVACLLLTLLIVGLSGGFGLRLGLGNILREAGDYYHAYEDSDLYSIGGARIAAQDVREIEVMWIDGRVNVVSGEGGEIVFSETSHRSLDQGYQMHYYVKDGRLTIQYCAARMAFRGISRSFEKELTLTVPKGLLLSSVKLDGVSTGIFCDGVSAERITLDTMSGGIRIANLEAGKSIEVNTISGEIVAQYVRTQSINVNTMSGDVELLACALAETSCDTVSGSMHIEPGADAKRISTDTMSGDVRVRLPEITGFTARYASMSGDFHSNFPVTTEKKVAVYGTGEIAASFSSVSGDMYIEKE